MASGNGSNFEVIAQAIADGKKIRVKNIERMWGLGTPEDLEHYLKYHEHK